MLNMESHQIHLGLKVNLRVAFGQSKQQKESMPRTEAVEPVFGADNRENAKIGVH
jgi:hypothetical protein